MSETIDLRATLDAKTLTPNPADVTNAVAAVLREQYGFLLFSQAMGAARAAVATVEASPSIKRLREQRNA